MTLAKIVIELLIVVFLFDILTKLFYHNIFYLLEICIRHAQLKTKHRLSSSAVGSHVLEDIIETVVDAVIEREVVGDEKLALEHFRLELFYLLDTKVGDLWLFFWFKDRRFVIEFLILGGPHEP